MILDLHTDPGNFIWVRIFREYMKTHEALPRAGQMPAFVLRRYNAKLTSSHGSWDQLEFADEKAYTWFLLQL
jgi:hypothetical protein